MALDIGANRGWFTYPLSKLFATVYAFEINDELTDWIRDYNPGNIKLINYGLSSEPGTLTFYVPVMHGLLLDGWGSLNRNNLSGATEHREKQVRVVRLDDFEIADIGFVKIDVEGHEIEVLKGSVATITASRPIILVEIREENLEAADLWFQDLSYQRCHLEDLVGIKGGSENYVCVPAERLRGSGPSGDKRDRIMGRETQGILGNKENALDNKFRHAAVR